MIGLKLLRKETLLFGLGVAGTAATIVGAYVASKKSAPVIEDFRADIDTIHTVREAKSEEDYPKKVYRKELAHIYVVYGVKLLKINGPVIFGGIASLFSFGGAFKIVGDKLAETTAFASLIERSFSAYRDNVIKYDGEEADKKYAFGIEEEKTEHLEKDEKGKIKKVKGKVKTRKTLSGYAVDYDSYCPNHSKDPALNFKYLKDMEAYFDDQIRLRDKHRVWLCEVYTALGCYITKEQEKVAQKVFWQWSPEEEKYNPDGTRRPFVEFIMADDICRSFITGATDEYFESEYQEHITRLDIPDTQEARNYFKHNYYEPIIPIDFRPNGKWEDL